jgi:hypothetical protein
MASGKITAAISIAGYWLPAALIYLILRSIGSASRFTLSRFQTIVLTVANTILVLYVIARVLASSVPGGGAGSVVASFSTITTIPALSIAAAVLMAALRKNASAAFRRWRNKEHAGIPEWKPVSPRQAALVAIVGFGPVAYGLGVLFLGPDSPFLTAHKADRRMKQLCASAGEEIFTIPKGIEGVYLERDAALRLTDIRNGLYRSRGVGTIGEPLVNSGWIRYFETKAKRSVRDSTASPYERYTIQEKKEPVDELMSEYGVFRTKITTSADDRIGTEGYELSIKRLATDEVTATKRYFFSTKTRRVCALQADGVDEAEFLRRALGMQRRFDSLGQR